MLFTDSDSESGSSCKSDSASDSEFESDEDFEQHNKIMERNIEIYADLDELTFDFSDGMGRTKAHREKILQKYKKVLDKYPVLGVLKEGRLQDANLEGKVP